MSRRALQMSSISRGFGLHGNEANVAQRGVQEPLEALYT